MDNYHTILKDQDELQDELQERVAHELRCLTQAQEVKKRVGPDAQDLVYRPGYVIRRFTVKGVCVCVLRENENMLYSGEE